MKRLLLLSAFTLPFAVATTALADEPSSDAQPTANVAANAANVDRAPVADAAPKLKPITLTLNPLSLVLGRIGANVEYLPATHHAIVVNPYFQTLSVDGMDGAKTSYSNFGAELGYHYYTGSKGANGLYFGPSVFATSAHASATSTMSVNGVTQSQTASSSFLVYGAAFDVGAQHVADNGFTIGGGAGLMYLAANDSSAQTSSSFKVSGVLPRFLFTVGYSF